MRSIHLICLAVLLSLLNTSHTQSLGQQSGAVLVLQSNSLKPTQTGAHSLRLDGLFYETANGRSLLPATLTSPRQGIRAKAWTSQATMADGRVVSVSVQPQGEN